MPVNLMSKWTLAAFGLLVAAGSVASVRGAAEEPRASRDVVVGQAGIWTPTDLTLEPGERAVFKATGQAQCPGAAGRFGPEGLTRGFRDLLRILPAPQAGRGALIARIGDPDVAMPLLVGAGTDTVSVAGGPLALGVNREETDPCTAEFRVHIDVFAAQAGRSTRPASWVDSIPGADSELFSQIPRRNADPQGNAGDMVNFLILGNEAQMKNVFTTAGWVVVDADVRGALIAGAIASLSKQSYVTLPMSQLFLFKRPQDFGWAHAEPIKVAASRHHLRIWHAPFDAGGSMLWVGAATHDIGFERDRRNNGVTHKIDPQIDLERSYVEQTLTQTGLVESYTYVWPKDLLWEAKTATGGSFYSDGGVLVLKLSDQGDVKAVPAAAPTTSAPTAPAVR